MNWTGCRNVKKLKRQLYTDQNYRNAIRWDYRRDRYGHLAENIDLPGSSYWMQISHECSCLFGTSARSFCPIQVSATYKFIPVSWLVCSNARRKLCLGGMKSLRAITHMKGCRRARCDNSFCLVTCHVARH